MTKQRTFTAILHQEGDLYVAECPGGRYGQSGIVLE